jgi:hypothetical protein
LGHPVLLKKLHLQQRNNLAISSTIRSIAAGFLLVIFAFGITPKRTLHNFVANHKDGIANKRINKIKGAVVNRAALNCQVDNLVCESPFTPEASTLCIASPKIFSSYRNIFVSARYSSAHISFGLRGPPTV